MFNKDQFKINIRIEITVQRAAPAAETPLTVYIVTGSKAIDRVSYDDARRVLYITFHSGSTYEYTGVDYPVVRGLMAAFSKGTYFGKYIRNAYTTRDVTGEV